MNENAYAVSFHMGMISCLYIGSQSRRIPGCKYVRDLMHFTSPVQFSGLKKYVRDHKLKTGSLRDQPEDHILCGLWVFLFNKSVFKNQEIQNTKQNTDAYSLGRS